MLSPNLLMRRVAAAAPCPRALPSFAQRCSSLSFLNRPRLVSSLSATGHKDLGESIRNVNDAGFVMAKNLISNEAKDRNLVFSPLSIHGLLSLLTAGASGATKDNLLSFLKAKSPSHLNSFYSDLVAPVLADGSQDGGPKLSTANAIWTDKSASLKPGFKQVADMVYEADTSQVDFQNKADEAVGQINMWVEHKTKGLIKNLLSLDSIDPLTRAICANTLYFNGAWSQEFDKSCTKEYDFHLSDRSRVKVPFMTNSDDQFVRACDGFKVLRLPYQDGDGKDTRTFSMYIILPDSRDGLPLLVERVCSESGFMDSHIPRQEVEMDQFRIPKFKVSFEFQAGEVLKRLGLAMPLGAEGGGFSEMVDSVDPLVYVSDIKHKAVIEVDEKGTEAAAATINVKLGSSRYYFPPEPVESFVADHPFMYVIREDTTGTVLFIGQVLDPLLT